MVIELLVLYVTIIYFSTSFKSNKEMSLYDDLPPPSTGADPIDQSPITTSPKQQQQQHAVAAAPSLPSVPSISSSKLEAGEINQGLFCCLC